jgi:chromosome segregation ATPase
MPKDLTLEVLKQIRDEAKATNARLGTTNNRLETMDGRLETMDGRLEKLERRQSEMEVRLATELVAVANAVRQLRDTLVADRDLRKTVAAHEKRISSLEQQSH